MFSRLPLLMRRGRSATPALYSAALLKAATGVALPTASTSTEWDVNPYQQRVNRETDRIVIGSDGRKTCTGGHYANFTGFDQGAGLC